MNLDICEGLLLQLRRGGKVVLIACSLHSWASGWGMEKCVFPILSAARRSRQTHSAFCQGPREVQRDRTKHESQEMWTQRRVSRRLDLTLGKSLMLGACIPPWLLSAGHFTALLLVGGKACGGVLSSPAVAPAAALCVAPWITWSVVLKWKLFFL